MLQRCGTDTLLVLHRGEVVAEHYFRGGAETQHLAQSVTKSVAPARRVASVRPQPFQ